MPRKVCHTEQWTAFFTLLGGLATAGGAAAVVWQISDAREALHASNTFLAEKDVGEAFDQILSAQKRFMESGQNPDDNGSAAHSKGELTRVVFHFDGVFQAIGDLNANGALGVENWRRLVQRLCPQLARYSYSIAGNDAPSSRAICESEKDLWKTAEN
jgi:hypothetical protein